VEEITPESFEIGLILLDKLKIEPIAWISRNTAFRVKVTSSERSAFELATKFLRLM